MLFAMQSGERKRRIQASELGTYLYCARALGYRRAGAPSENRAQMEAGELDHDRLSRSARRIRGSVSLLAALLVLAALTLWMILRSEGG
ncbi:hypothetical protein BEQ56_02695 [Anaerolineaceae bacterium oral taxon 439]|nr:hypothetical protein BEQ56_02695 [Anaerolineaceae bacterium oral taxon 439]